MSREPGLDIATTLRRQFVVDIGVQFVFGDGNSWVGHCRCLCPGSVENRLQAGGDIPSPQGEAIRKPSSLKLVHHTHMHNACHYFTRRSAGRSPSSEAFTCARARAKRDITVPIGTP